MFVTLSFLSLGLSSCGLAGSSRTAEWGFGFTLLLTHMVGAAWV